MALDPILDPVSTWTADDVLHLARRAGFGLSPEQALAYLAAFPAPQAGVDAWVDGTHADPADLTRFQAVLGASADPVDEPQRGSAPNLAPAVPGPHRYLVDGADAWRNDLSRAQASWAFRMQFDPYPFRERVALFWHNLFATGWQKVDSAALMLNQIETLRSQGLSHFADLHVAVSKDPAMAIWLDSVLNNASGTRTPNENYAREALELYSLGADNGYSQRDITELARALSGWSFTVSAAQRVQNPTSPTSFVASGGTFRVYDGQANAAGEWVWNDLGRATPPTTLSRRHGTGTITFLDRTFDIGAAPAGTLEKGEDALRSIVGSRPAQCAEFLARRLLLHFVTGRFSAAQLGALKNDIQDLAFDLRAVMKRLLASQLFFSPDARFALAEGPVSWTVRAARALGPTLAVADGRSPKAFPAWTKAAPSFDPAGMKLLDPSGPNGWHEDEAWVNSNTIRYRTRLAAAVALAETASGLQGGQNLPIFPTQVADWFPATPGSGAEVLARLEALLQPAPIPAAVRDDWVGRFFPAGATFAWDQATQDKARQLAFLVLCSPSGQLY
jgi:uncharacterized protein (DUF1800 family)